MDLTDETFEFENQTKCFFGTSVCIQLEKK